jgi:hypothetical protein
MFAIERLMREGVRGDTARDLVVSYGAERCLRYAEALDVQEGIRNRASFLVSAIREGYAIPESPEEPSQEPSQEPLEPPLVSEDPPREPPPPDPAAEELWARVLEHAQGEIDASSLRVWFGGVTAVALGPASLTISAPTPFAREYIETRFHPALEASLQQELSDDASLHVVVNAEATDLEHQK